MGHLSGLVCRRDLLRIGSLSVAASALPAGLVAGPGSRKNAPREGQGKAKSVIFLWMAGGVTHIDSFDPKPEAPVEIRGTLGDIATRLPGVRFCETVPELAAIADKLAVLRSFSHDSNDHLISQVYTLSGRKVTMRSSTASRTSARSSGGCKVRAAGCRDTSPCRASRGPGRRPTTCSSAAGWAASMPRIAWAAAGRAGFHRRREARRPAGSEPKRISAAVAGPAAEVPLARLSGRRQLRDASTRPCARSTRATRCTRPNRSIKTPCGC